MNRPESKRATFQPKGTLKDWTPAEIEAMAKTSVVNIADARADAVRSDVKLAALLEARGKQ